MPAPYFNFLVQRLTKRLVRGCENFVLALASLLCLAAPGSCSARFTYLFVPLCMYFYSVHRKTAFIADTLASFAPRGSSKERGGINTKLRAKPGLHSRRLLSNVSKSYS